MMWKIVCSEDFSENARIKKIYYERKLSFLEKGVMKWMSDSFTIRVMVADVSPK